MEDLVLGKTYNRREIRDLVGGGDLQSYLPQVAGRAVAGCFDPQLNLRAPIEIDVGAGPRVIETARALVKNAEEIPVFLKRSSNAWEYVGRFRATGYSEVPVVLSQPDRRPDAVAVFFLEEVEPESTLPGNAKIAVPDAREENRALIRHLRRERSRELVLAKRRLVKARNGYLSCEACGLRASTSLGEAGEACFEAHHLEPLSEATGPVSTRLDDLALLCANCHRIIHRLDPLPSVAHFRSLISPAA